MKTQFIVQEHDIIERREFYNYIHENYEIMDKMDPEVMINDHFPFVVDLKEKILWVCNSITCLAAASQTHQIITISAFKENESSKKKIKKM